MWNSDLPKLSEGLSLESPRTTQSSLSSIFDEEPVDLETFIQDKKFLGFTNFNLSPIQSEAVQVMERVYYPELYPLMAEEFDSGDYWGQDIPMRNLITLQYGKGSGKDALSRFASLRVAYLLMCLKNPQDYFGIADIDSIHLLNVASNAPQAMRAFFKPMTQAVKRGWFKDKANPTQNSIVYAKNIEAVSGHSDAEGQEGLNIMLGVLDEIDAFKSRDELVGTGKKLREASTTAESILEMVKSSAASRFPQTYKRVSISYPRYLGSTIQKLTEEGKKSNEKYKEKSIHYVSGPYATWEVNPRIKGREDFQEEYDMDPLAAAAKYECKPTRAMDPFYKNMSIFKIAVDREDQPITVDYKVAEYYSSHAQKTVRGWEPVYTFAPDFKPIEGAIYAIHGDLALKHDSAGIAMSHVVKWETVQVTRLNEAGEPYVTEDVRPIVRNDFTFSFSADSTAKDENGAILPREIQIRWVEELVFTLIQRGFFVGSYTSDSFASAHLIQNLQRRGIEADKLSTDRDPSIYSTLKDIASESRLRMPFNQTLMNELEGLSKLDNGKIDHPPGGSKDQSDAFSCSIVRAIEVGGEESENGAIVDVGAPIFSTGGALAPLEGYDDVIGAVGSPFSLPIGLTNRGFNGW